MSQWLTERVQFTRICSVCCCIHNQFRFLLTPPPYVVGSWPALKPIPAERVASLKGCWDLSTCFNERFMTPLGWKPDACHPVGRTVDDLLNSLRSPLPRTGFPRQPCIFCDERKYFPILSPITSIFPSPLRPFNLSKMACFALFWDCHFTPRPNRS